MRHWTIIACAVAIAGSAWAQEVGRTDGPEGSEYGAGGNPFGTPAGRIYLTGAFGSGFYGSPRNQQTGFLYGAELGYEMHDWIGVQTSYAYLSDREMSIYGLGATFSYPWHPFVYNLNLQAGFYDPTIGSSHFGIAPGACIDIVLSESLRLGLNYRHDFIFTDNTTTDVDRLYAGIKFVF